MSCASQKARRVFFLPGEDHIINGGTDWGIPPQRDDHRKVLLWSRSPWPEIDCVGSPALPPGRFVKGVTETSIGRITVVGVCIPWDGAPVSSGRKDRKRREDHRAWLEAFERLPWRLTTDRMVVLGDFNQRIPRTRVSGASKETHEMLLRAFEGLRITTAGEPGVAIDHIAHTKDLKRTTRIELWPRRNPGNELMSDHIGVWADFSLAATA